MTHADERRPAGNGAAPTTTGRNVAPRVPHRGEPPTVIGLVYAPAARRQRYMVVIERCPHCTGMHHAWTWLMPVKVMRRRCGTWGRRYYVRPTLVRQPGRRREVMRHAR